MKNAGLLEHSFYFLVWLTVAIGTVQAQVGIGPTSGTVDGSASLEVKSGPYPSGSPYRGLLTPTVTTTQRNQIQNPAKGLLIFNTTTNQMEVNTGTATAPIWVSGVNNNTSWSLLGNAGTTSSNFLGTTDDIPLRFRVNNQNAGRIDRTLNSVGLGYLALNPSATGQGNTALGALALASNTSSNYNTAVGLQALTNNTIGSGNTALGTVALLTNTSGQFNTASGYRALYMNTTGTGNTASGAVTLENNTSGNNNTAFGQVALAANTTGNYNTAGGAGALQNNTSGNSNTILGHNAAAANTTGYANVGVGEDALLVNVDGHDNVGLGSAALLGNTSGSGNMASGNLALSGNTTGSINTAVGLLALRYNTTGSRNTALGYDAGPLAANPNLTNSTAIGANAVVNASNQIVLGDNNITSLRCNVQTISSLSDKRIKENIKANVPGLKFITKLTPVTYHVNKSKEAKLVGYSLDNIQEDKVLHSGFLAQDVEVAAKAVGYDFEGVVQQEGGKYYTLGYTLFVIPLVQAVKDLDAEVNQLKAELAAMKEKDKATHARLDQLEALLTERGNEPKITFKP
jgi:hypothetical protein